jgi:hypothetical protein
MTASLYSWESGEGRRRDQKKDTNEEKTIFGIGRDRRDRGGAAHRVRR